MGRSARSGRPAAVAALLIAAFLAIPALLAAPAAAASKQKAGQGLPKGSRWRQEPAPAPAPGAQQFMRHGEGHDPLLWEDDELTRVRNLHAKDFSDKADYLKSASLADYLGLGPVESMHLMLPLHIVFVGFQGDGNARISVDEVTLTEWFSTIDHLMPHARVSLADLSCHDDGHCAGQVSGTVAAPSPLPSHVRLNFSCNVVVVQRHEVLETYERAVAAFSRPVDPDFEAGTQQVDALKLEAFMDSFVEGLGLDQGYTMIVVNPKWSAQLASYGFRAGFSLDELELLQRQVPQMRQLSLSHWEGEPKPPSGHALGTAGFFLGGWNHRAQKMSVSQLQSESMAWVKRAQAYLAAEEDHRRKLLKAVGPRTAGALAVARAVGMLRDRARSEVAQLLGAMITLPAEHFYNPKWRASHPLEDCLTNAWVGHGRWLLLDLTAQKADYGPAMGGEGVVTAGTVPDVSGIFAEMRDAREAARDEHVAQRDDEQALRDELSDRALATRNREPKLVDDHDEVTRVHLEGIKGVQLGKEAKLTPDEIQQNEQETLIQMELDVYEQFALEHCHNRINPPIACTDARRTVTELRHELSTLGRQSTNDLRIFRDHHWDIFGMDDAITSHHEVQDAASRVMDHFMGQLSDILSSGVRHVIAPPSATWHHDGMSADTASPYAAKVHFTVHVIQDNSRKLGDFRARGVAFDVERYKAQVLRLALPHQHFAFTLTELNLLDDAALAAAFSVSLRTAFAQVPDAVSRPQETEVLYIDSQELAFHLRRRFPTGRRNAAAHDPHATLEVPVFVFNLDRDVPILVDEHYNARALEDLIVIAENAANQDEHPTGFTCDGALLSRPLSPMRHALAATLQYLGGVLPPHIGYHPGRESIMHNWLWSVGAHPLSWTSTGTAYSQLHIDALHRSYVLDSLDRTVEAVNAGVAMLAAEKPSDSSYARVAAAQAPLRQALQTYAQLVNLWRGCVSHVASMEFGAAAEMIHGMESMALAFYKMCQEVHEHFHPQRCADRTPIPVAFLRWVLAGSLGAVALTALITCRPRRKSKKV